MKFLEAIEAASTKKFARNSIVILADGREIITQADPEAVRELAAEIEAAVEARFHIEDDLVEEEPWKAVGPRRAIPPEVLEEDKKFSEWLHGQTWVADPHSSCSPPGHPLVIVPE